MVKRMLSFGLLGVRGYKVEVECFTSGGLPDFSIVGLPDTAIREARDRIRAAAKSGEYKFPKGRVTINLAPANTKKEGTVYDLPILLGILSASGEIPDPPEDSAFIGELSLTGELRQVNGTLPMALAAKRENIKQLFVPRQNAAEAALVEGIEVIPVLNVQEIVAHIKGEKKIPAHQHKIPRTNTHFVPDFAEVKGQENVKRAMEVAAAGGHNILLVGPPGSGKSMLASRLPGILPDMTLEEAMETTEIHSIMGMTTAQEPLVITRPFRAPHHTTSAVAMAGGGAKLRPGEVSLAHNGVLFLDELPEYRRDVIEVLRQPMEDGKVTVSRVAGSESYPSRFMLVCAMNPCRCGWYGHPSGRCTCSQVSVDRYVGKISGPLLDRIDMHVGVASVEYDDLAHKPMGERSEEIKKRVNAARAIQVRRFADSVTRCNAQMTAAETQKYCKLDDSCEKLVRGVFEKLKLTARGYDKILRIARTIADLAGSENIAPPHLAEAVQYKSTFNRE